jgi:hypothetical protein
MENTKKKKILATLSQAVADRDKAASEISSILDLSFSQEIDSVKLLKKQFKKISESELIIQSIQMYYANNFTNKDEIINKEMEDSDGNNS